jgi:hypothetical protein
MRSGSQEARSRGAAPGAGLEELYHAYWDPMVRLATLLVDRPAVAEELVQERSYALSGPTTGSTRRSPTCVPVW